MTVPVYTSGQRQPLRDTTRGVLRAIEWALWIVAGIVLIVVIAASLQSAIAQERGKRFIDLQQFSVDQSHWSDTRIARYEAAQATGVDLPIVGVLEIPAIDLEVAVFDGTSKRLLNLGVGRVGGTARVGERGNVSIAGHRDGFFRGLKDIKVGNEIVLRGTKNDVRYRVDEIFVVQPDDVTVLAPSVHSELTLITCYPFYFVGSAPQRYIVRARGVDTDSMTKAEGD